MIGDLPMKRRVLTGLRLAAVALSLGLAGCGGAGISEGLPTDNLPEGKLDPKFTDMTGRSFLDQKKSEAKARASEKEGGTAPAPEAKK